MVIGFIGAGKVGNSLGKYFKLKGLKVMGYYSIIKEDAINASKFVGTECYDNLSDLIDCCDTLFLTVNDDSIVSVCDNLRQLNIKNHYLIHTSGCKSSEIFGDLKKENKCYSIHPIFAVMSKEESYKDLCNAAFTIEGYEDNIDYLINVFSNMGNIIKKIDTKNKIKYHAACVMMSNLVNSLIFTAKNIINDIGIDDFSIFSPLFINNMKNIEKYGPQDSITGPCMRGDLSTIVDHLNNLDEYSRKVYSLLSLNICNMKDEYKNEDIIKCLLEGVLNEKYN